MGQEFQSILTDWLLLFFFLICLFVYECAGATIITFNMAGQHWLLMRLLPSPPHHGTVLEIAGFPQSE